MQWHDWLVWIVLLSLPKVNVKLSDPETGEPTGAVLVVGLRVVAKAVGFGVAQERVFELERFAVTQGGWGSGRDHFLPMDPVKRKERGRCAGIFLRRHGALTLLLCVVFRASGRTKPGASGAL
jgi:hypothetical protein